MKNDTNISDSELVRLYLTEHDDSVFNMLYQRYRLPLFAYLHKLLPNNKSLVEDMFQQVWMKAVANFQKYENREKFLAWLCRIGHNLVVDHFRRSAVRGSFVELNEELCADLAAPDDTINQENLEERIEQALARLPAEQRQVLELRRQGVAFKNIAEQLKINLNTVLGRMHYAVQKMKLFLGELS